MRCISVRPGCGSSYASELERELASAAWQALRDESIGWVELVLYEDGSVQTMRLGGCTAEQVSAFRHIIEPIPPNAAGTLELIQHVTVPRP